MKALPARYLLASHKRDEGRRDDKLGMDHFSLPNMSVYEKRFASQDVQVEFEVTGKVTGS